MERGIAMGKIQSLFGKKEKKEEQLDKGQTTLFSF